MQQTSDEIALLADLELTRDLPDDAREELAAKCRFQEVGGKKRVKVAGLNGDRIFLVDGHAVRLSNGVAERLQAFQGLSEPEDLCGDSPGAEDCFVTESPCIVFRIPGAELARLLSDGVRVEDMELDPKEGEFLAEIYHLVSNNTLVLPARPEVALKIQEMTNDPEAGIADLTEIIQSDGTIAGALLHATNSPLFRAAKEIKSIREAVVRLGFRNTRMLAVNLALRQAFLAKHAVTKEAMEAVWTDSVLTSAFSYVISDHLKILDRDRALLGGLVAGIGGVPIIQFIELRESEPKMTTIQSLLGKLCSITGVLVINYWGIGDDLVAVAENFDNWSYEPDSPDYASIAIVARWAALQSEGAAHPSASEVPAFRVLGLTPPEPGEAIAELESSSKTLESLKSMFNL
ncbi:HDOD domain-containing protein [Thiorhodococcus mannitoliphagus]|uniref:HDOD domain-containing protein n=1 Tax=Thiorhodococcus mannitoliphagus TaxID=329406 RepID=A0A6P1E095_9GAMM|nr:HDOD domain-containing protein [Thiorhodococcus mannitoliphagus]NEX21185.1 HDOD domain-containing protein [Thiorhodococcus mannitoliphagus]